MSGGARHLLTTIECLLTGPKTQRQLLEATLHAPSTISEHMKLLRERKRIEFAGFVDGPGMKAALWKWKETV